MEQIGSGVSGWQLGVSFMCNPSRPDLVSKLNSGLAQVMGDGKYAELCNQNVIGSVPCLSAPSTTSLLKVNSTQPLQSTTLLNANSTLASEDNVLNANSTLASEDNVSGSGGCSGCLQLTVVLIVCSILGSVFGLGS
eukprot:TRINITY_DN2907_c0_g1_i3.p1 TRINITY_DN2907_c0_g1~~TRINITY_DN2907_c0_g1_i3.p1  ORF type:complete len:137 (-),score=20.22 TRINITY_DN2907_c0_g1_i3:498-908(-)